MEVWEEIKRRAEQSIKNPAPPSSPYHMESEGLIKLKNATKRSLWTIAHPIKAVASKGHVGGVVGSSPRGNTASSDTAPGEQASSPLGLLFIVGLGMAGVVYFRRPTRNDSMSEELLPPRKPADRIVASSPAEPRRSLLYFFREWIYEPFFTFVRFVHLALLFGPVILTSPMLIVGKVERRKRLGKPVPDDADNWGAVWWYGFLVKQMERAGPSFIKLGQWAASRADLFPATLCDRMSKLHSSAKPHSISHTRRVIEKAFNLKFDDIFEEFGTTPIGCGAIAQVSKRWWQI
jgi:aarF domain-containing kinase